VVAIELGASAQDLARTFHAHPTLSEVGARLRWSRTGGRSIPDTRDVQPVRAGPVSVLLWRRHLSTNGSFLHYSSE
jgi:hypothetical protein